MATDADAIAFIAAAGISDATQQSALDTLVIALKAAELWERMVAIYPFVGGTAATHKWNLKDPRDLDAAKRLTFSGTLTHSSNGVLPNGTTGYADTHIDLAIDVPSYSLHQSYYSRTNTAPPVDDKFLFGLSQGLGLDFFNTNGWFVASSQVNAAGSQVTATASGQTNFNRLVGLSMYGYDSFKLYRSTTQIASTTTVRFGYWPSIDPNSPRTVYLFARNSNNTAQLFSAYQCAWYSLGFGLDATQWAALNTIVEAFQLTLGRNV